MYFYFCFDLQERESWSKTKIALKCIKEIVVIVEAESCCRHQKLYFRGRPDDDFFAGLNFYGYVKVHSQLFYKCNGYRIPQCKIYSIPLCICIKIYLCI